MPGLNYTYIYKLFIQYIQSECREPHFQVNFGIKALAQRTSRAVVSVTVIDHRSRQSRKSTELVHGETPSEIIDSIRLIVAPMKVSLDSGVGQQ